MLAGAAVLVSLALGAADPASGRVESREGRTEVLSTPVRVGERVELPEGWYRVEEAGPEDREVGTFTVMSSAELAAEARAVSERAAATTTAPAAPPMAARPVPPERRAAERPAQRCRAERSAYLRELWRMSGIEVSDPVGIVDGLELGPVAPPIGAPPYGSTFSWLAFVIDPIRPLAWSSNLRDRAEALARCQESVAQR